MTSPSMTIQSAALTADEFPIGASGVLTTPDGREFNGYRGSKNLWRTEQEDPSEVAGWMLIEAGDRFRITDANEGGTSPADSHAMFFRRRWTPEDAKAEHRSCVLAAVIERRMRR